MRTVHVSDFLRPIRSLLLVALLVMSAAPAGRLASQETPGRGDAAAREIPATLDAVEAALDSGRVEAARSGLDRWFAEGGGEEAGPEATRARFLRARLAEDAEVAEPDYLEVAVTGDTRYGAPAGLRLGQLRLARGEPGRAAEALDRLRRDFPGHELVPDAWLWTGRARTAAGEREAACEAFGRAAEIADRRGRGEVERQARRALRNCDPAAVAGADPDLPGHGVQIGAFSSRETAELLRERAERDGYTARVVASPGPERLYRVRVGAFAERAEAERLAERLEADGFSTLIVTEEAASSP